MDSARLPTVTADIAYKLESCGQRSSPSRPKSAGCLQSARVVNLRRGGVGRADSKPCNSGRAESAQLRSLRQRRRCSASNLAASLSHGLMSHHASEGGPS